MTRDVRHFGSKISSILQKLVAATAVQLTTKNLTALFSAV